MSLDYKFQSLEGGFPRELTNSWERNSSPFGKTWTEVQELLERELRFLKYRTGSVVLQTAHSPYDVRKDGRLRSDVRRPEHPGVVLKFEVYDSEQKRYVPMSFECDRFTEWKANVRAIADAMEALRKVDRYGVSGGGKQNAHYEGYKALPAANGFTDDDFADGMLAGFIAHYSEFAPFEILKSQDVLTKAYKQAARKLHPDNRETGSAEHFLRLKNAYEALKK
jgi:hypothetical protein